MVFLYFGLSLPLFPLEHIFDWSGRSPNEIIFWGPSNEQKPTKWSRYLVIKIWVPVPSFYQKGLKGAICNLLLLETRWLWSPLKEFKTNSFFLFWFSLRVLWFCLFLNDSLKVSKIIYKEYLSPIPMNYPSILPLVSWRYGVSIWGMKKSPQTSKSTILNWSHLWIYLLQNSKRAWHNCFHRKYEFEGPLP